VTSHVIVEALMYSLPMIAVRSVQGSVEWYRRLLNCGTDNVSEEFARLRSAERILLLLHDWDAEEHSAWENDRAALSQ
jgi:hypothetical protein